MTTFTATFGNGKNIARNTKTGRTYSHAWATFGPLGGIMQTGFSSSAEAADRAARSYLKFVGHVRHEVVKAVVE